MRASPFGRPSLVPCSIAAALSASVSKSAHVARMAGTLSELVPSQASQAVCCAPVTAAARRRGDPPRRAGLRALPKGSSPANSPSRHGQPDRAVVAGRSDQTISSHRLDHRPVVPQECRGIGNALRFNLDAASLSSALVRYLKMKRVGCRLGVFAGRPASAAHLVSPLWCVEPGHFEFTILLFVRRVDGEVRPALEPD